MLDSFDTASNVSQFFGYAKIVRARAVRVSLLNDFADLDGFRFFTRRVNSGWVERAKIGAREVHLRQDFDSGTELRLVFDAHQDTTPDFVLNIPSQTLAPDDLLLEIHRAMNLSPLNSLPR